MKACWFTVLIVFLSLLAQGQKKGTVTIHGTLDGDLKGYEKIYLYTRLTNDSAAINEGKYTFTFPFERPMLKFLYPAYIKEQHMMYQPYGILITGPGKYYVHSDITKGMQASVLKGPEAMVLYNQFERDSREASRKVNKSLAGMYGDSWWKQDEKSDQYATIQKSADSLRGIYPLRALEQLIRTHPDSYASAYALLSVGKQAGTIEDKERLYEMLSPGMKQSKPGHGFHDFISGLKNGRVGKVVADFTLPDPEGKPIDFSEVKGKYVLIDFWASWCWPCRKSFPHMREVYKKYGGDKFEIYSISIDEDKDAWEKAVKEEKNTWLQSLDTKNISQKGFAVTAVPATFLIGPKGTILAKEVGFDPNGQSEIEKMIIGLHASGKL